MDISKIMSQLWFNWLYLVLSLCFILTLYFISILRYISPKLLYRSLSLLLLIKYLSTKQVSGGREDKLCREVKYLLKILIIFYELLFLWSIYWSLCEVFLGDFYHILFGWADSSSNFSHLVRFPRKKFMPHFSRPISYCPAGGNETQNIYIDSKSYWEKYLILQAYGQKSNFW